MNENGLKILTKAYQFASFKHRFQKRKNADALPYINHPIQVVNILTHSDVFDSNILCAAVLHDTLEDTEATETQIQKQFGIEVLQYVLQCTDDKKLSKVQRKINQIEHSLHISKEAKLIKIADKISNNEGLLKQTPQGWTKQRTFGYFIWSEAVFRNLEGDNLKLNARMKAVFQQAGIYKLSQEQKKQKLLDYYEILGQSKES